MKPRMPSVDIEMSDVCSITQISHEQLEATPFEKRKWHCCIEGCSGYATVRDYGNSPLFYWRKKWLDLRYNIFYCGKHWPLFKKSGMDDSKFNYKPGTGIEHLDNEINHECN